MSPSSTYVIKELKRLSGKALHTHNMIREGDHVLVAVSGGKDSLALLWFLRERMKWIPVEYKITAVHVDPGFGGRSGDKMEAFFTAHKFDYRIIKTDIGPSSHGPENRENPCFLCSRLRRKRIFDLAGEIGCNRIAFGHHKDDMIETFFLNVFYGASISTMMPVQELFAGKLTLIRPFYLVEEKILRRYAVLMNWPDISLECPSSGLSKREEIKKMLNSFYRSNRKVKGNIFHALQNVNPDYLPKS
ncbi:MAG: ATP-binding protein [Desulfatiglans sp.]|jgi:tRNA 2-thiocytidine biosynthesis protein TtcA|nr:ATP-binding protein [Thermodesulfobacteriota bacterium]MEE4352943.1 ATP-binding protein [Desulfatiglans sp.]